MFFAAIPGWVRFSLTLSNGAFYTSLGIQPGIEYLAATGIASGLVYTLGGVMALIPGKTGKRVSLVLLSIGLCIHYIDRIFFARSVESQTALPFSLTFATLLTILATGLLFWEEIRSSIKR